VKKPRLYAIYNSDGARVTAFCRDTILDAWKCLSWRMMQGIDEVRAKYEPLGFECWEVEIVKRRKVRPKFKKEKQCPTRDPK
jgi:hypothetical protein